jgi:hypothetical protein
LQLQRLPRFELKQDCVIYRFGPVVAFSLWCELSGVL